jgi:hypothetical protein
MNANIENILNIRVGPEVSRAMFPSSKIEKMDI